MNIENPLDSHETNEWRRSPDNSNNWELTYCQLSERVFFRVFANERYPYQRLSRSLNGKNFTITYMLHKNTLHIISSLSMSISDNPNETIKVRPTFNYSPAIFGLE